MGLTPPKIIGRLTPCSSAVIVRTQLSGSLVEIFANDVKIGTKSGSSPDDFVVFDSGVILAAGAKITAKQTLGSDTSLLAHSPVVIVQSKPSSVGGINFPAPLHVCGECVFVDGVEPGAKVQISVGGIPRGNYEGKINGFWGQNGDGAFVRLNPQIGSGNILEGQQFACNLQGSITQSVLPELPHGEGPLPIPVVKEPLKECEQTLTVISVLEGALVTLKRSVGPSVSGFTAFSSGTFPLSLPLKAGETVTVNQQFPKCGLHSQDSSPPSTVQIREPIESPIVIPPLCSGATSVRLAHLYKRSKVRIFRNNANPIIGQTPDLLLQDDSYDFIVGPLSAGEVISAEQELCDVWSVRSNSVRVDNAPLTVPPVEIPGPLYECATIVRVKGIRAGAIVHIFNTQSGSTEERIINANPQEVYYSSQADIRVYPALETGDLVYAIQIGCSIPSDKSNVISVEGFSGEPWPPIIISPLDSCDCGTISVTNVIPGAQVDIFVNTLWVGSAYAADSTLVWVPIPTCLVAGDIVKSRQRLCDLISSFSENIIVKACPPVTSIGPTRITSGGLDAVGILFSGAIDPSDTNTIYVGSHGCGVWKTIDGGDSWIPVTDNLPTLEIGAIAIDPSNSSRIYVLTTAYGLFRSDNAGTSWTSICGNDLGYPDKSSQVVWGDLLIDPTNTNILYLSSTDGVYRSNDGGLNWQLSKNGVGSATDLIMDASNPNTLYVAFSNDGIYKTTDGGITGDPSWTRLGDGLPYSNNIPPINDIRYITLAQRRGTPNVLYAMYVFSSSPVVQIFRTTDAGASWSFISNPDLFGAPIAVTPISEDINQDIVYLGGLGGTQGFYRSVDGGQTFSGAIPGPHVDHHRIILDPIAPNTLYTLCDGGIYKSTNNGAPGSWSFIGKGLENVEFYDIRNSVTNSNLVIGGTQDNGTIRYAGTSTVWNKFNGGDGGTVDIDPTNAQILYFMNQGDESITRSFDGGNTKTNIGLDTPEICFNLHFQVHPDTPNILLASCVSLWQSTTQGSAWTQLFTPPTASGNVVRSAIDPSVDLYYAGSNIGTLFAGPSGQNWQNVFTHPNSWKVSDIEIDPQDANVIYVSFLQGPVNDPIGNNRIFRLIRSSAAPTSMTAQDITSYSITYGKIPFNLNVQALAIDRERPLTVYAGTNKGLYRGHSDDDGTTWSWLRYGPGMPSADIRTLDMHPTTSIMRIGTFGRGAYEVNTSIV
jgi:photosystem II stability/assembly factor-like uncharacterized protein